MSIDFTNVMKNKTAYLTMEEINKMLNYCYDKGNYRDYMLLVVLSRTGRRITEIVGEKPYRKVGLRPCDLHDNLIEFDILKKNHIKSRSTKTGNILDSEKIKKARSNKMPKRLLVAVDSLTMDALRKYIEYNNIQPHERIFKITRQRADVIIKAVAKACNISRSGFKVHAHMFRHSMAINLLKDNPNDASAIASAQKQLDHSNINLTYHYAQFTQEDQISKLDKLFNKNKGE